MKTLTLVPDGWPCKLSECPPGLFVCGDDVAVKTDYGEDEAYLDNGDRFHGAANTGGTTGDTLVQPVVVRWVEDAE